MQKSQLDFKTKSKILLALTALVLAISIPFFMPSLSGVYRFHIGIHITAIILASFLSIVGFITYQEFRTTRLLLVMCAFVTITLAEMVALLSFIFYFGFTIPNLDSLIMHGLILLMLSFFAAGIFKRN